MRTRNLAIGLLLASTLGVGCIVVTDPPKNPAPPPPPPATAATPATTPATAEPAKTNIVRLPNRHAPATATTTAPPATTTAPPLTTIVPPGATTTAPPATTTAPPPNTCPLPLVWDGTKCNYSLPPGMRPPGT